MPSSEPKAWSYAEKYLKSTQLQESGCANNADGDHTCIAMLVLT